MKIRKAIACIVIVVLQLAAMWICGLLFERTVAAFSSYLVFVCSSTGIWDWSCMCISWSDWDCCHELLPYLDGTAFFWNHGIRHIPGLCRHHRSNPYEPAQEF